MNYARVFARIARAIFGKKIAEIRTGTIAQVVAYDKATNLVSVQPVVESVRSKDPRNLTTILLPQLDDVPVKQRGSGKGMLTCAPAVGAYGWLSFSDRCIEQWITDGGTGSPRASRMFDLNDCVFDPGLYPLTVDGDNGKIDGGIADDRISLRTRSGNTEISVLHDETVQVSNASGSVVINTSGEVIINGGTALVARKDDPTLVNATTDPVFLHAATGWVTLVSAAINALAPGSITVVPATITGKVNDGSSTVKVP